MAYRDDLTALSARRDALVREVADTSSALDEASRVLDQAHGRARLPVLDNIRVAAPCTASWNRMAGDQRVRHCGDCEKNVYNLSGVTRAEAEALITENNGDLCVRYYQRHDGTILLADCEVGGQQRQVRRKRHLFAASAAAMLAIGGGSYLELTRTSMKRCDTPQDYDNAVQIPSIPLSIPRSGSEDGDGLTLPPPTAIQGQVVTPTVPSHELVMGRISASPPAPVPTTPTHIKMGKMVIRGDK